MRAALSVAFGAKSQVAVGVACLLVAVAAWVYWGWISHPTTSAIFHVSMFFGVVACYAIVATGLGFRATERVEAHVEGQNVEVEHADKVVEREAD